MERSIREEDLTSLDQALTHLPEELRSELEKGGFSRETFLTLAASRSTGAAERAARNRVKGDVQPPRPDELRSLPPAGSPEEVRLRTLGEESLARGEVAFCVLAGGMATRMGGLVKALVEVVPGKTFLDLRLAENRLLGEKTKKPIPLWLMTSAATNAPIEAALRERGVDGHVRTFLQNLSLRLDPAGGLFYDAAHRPSTYAPGHGDVVDALRRAKLLDGFMAQGGKVVWVANLDNLGAAVDPVILGAFLDAQHSDLMVEVCPKEDDKGGIPVHAEGHLQVLEEFRLPPDFDATSVPVFSTNTFLIRAQPLATVHVAWHWFEVEKKVDGRTAIQFERLLQELTAALPTTYVRIPRQGAAARFLPVKDWDELARRKEAIVLVARHRGIL